MSHSEDIPQAVQEAAIRLDQLLHNGHTPELLEKIYGRRHETTCDDDWYAYIDSKRDNDAWTIAMFFLPRLIGALT